MFPRRLLRLKVFKILYAYYHNSNDSLYKFEEELKISLKKTYELFLFFLNLIIEIKNFEYERLLLREKRLIKSNKKEDYSRNFIENKVIHLLEINNEFQKLKKEITLNILEHSEFFYKFNSKLWNYPNFIQYLLIDKPKFNDDKKIVINIYEDIISQEEDLFQLLEDHNIHWSDDYEFCISKCIENIKNFKLKNKNNNLLFPMFITESDKEFCPKLFKLTINNKKENLNILSKYVENWELNRISLLDRILLEMAITEFKYFYDIPKNVILDEYIEISKYYSTEKSHIFINGVLDKIFEEEIKKN